MNSWPGTSIPDSRSRPWIKTHFGPRKTAATLLRALPELTLEDETFRHIEAQVNDR
jgi:hypothetical protein